MALFLHSHHCNSICTSLSLTPFDLAPSEIENAKSLANIKVHHFSFCVYPSICRRLLLFSLSLSLSLSFSVNFLVDGIWFATLEIVLILMIPSCFHIFCLIFQNAYQTIVRGTEEIVLSPSEEEKEHIQEYIRMRSLSSGYHSGDDRPRTKLTSISSLDSLVSILFSSIGWRRIETCV